MLAWQILLLDNLRLAQVNQEFHQAVLPVLVRLDNLDVRGSGRPRDVGMAAVDLLEKADHLSLRRLFESDDPELDAAAAMEVGVDNARRLSP